jgi:hypothetical protein
MINIVGATNHPYSSIPGFNILAQQEAIKTMTTGNKKEHRLKYLGVEMLRTDANKSSKPDVGLFRGLRERSDGEGAAAKVIKMILLGTKDKENDLKALNLDLFNVLSLKMLYGDTKEQIVFKSSKADQDQAMELLESALKEFQTEARMVDNDPEIIDVKTFEDVPKEFFSPQKAATVRTNLSSAGGFGIYNSSCGYQDDTWKEKEAKRKEEKERQDKMRLTPTNIKRKGELPNLKILNSMKKKVAAIAAGEYEEKLIDPDPKDTFEEKKSSAVVK